MSTKKVMAITLAICLIVIALAAAFYLYIVFSVLDDDQTWYPTDGHWYCEELSIMLLFGDDTDCYIVLNDTGEEIQCAWIVERGSDRITVVCQQHNAPWQMGEQVFYGKYIQKNESALIISEYKTNTEYTFIRVN